MMMFPEYFVLFVLIHFFALFLRKIFEILLSREEASSIKHQRQRVTSFLLKAKRESCSILV
jgi:hypothetical protein